MKLKVTPKANTSLAAKGAKPKGLGRNSSLIKRAISDSKESTTENKTDETEVSQEEEQDASPEAKQETEAEKKKNLDKLLNRGLKIKEEDSKKDTKKTDSDKNKEWQENSQAKEGDDKSRFEKAREKGLQDELRNDKSSIAKRYPGIERPGAGSRSGGGSQQQQQNSNSGSNNSSGNGSGGGLGGGSGVSKLAQSDGGYGGGSSGGSVNNSRFNQGNFGTRPNQGFNNNNGFVNQRPNINQGNQIGELKPLDPKGPDTRAEFRSLFANEKVNGKEIHAKSTEDARRIASSLRDIGAFEKVEASGSSIKVSGFDSSKDYDIHKAHGQVLGKEFLQGNINGFSFKDLDPETASTLQGLLSERAGEIGSENHSINSSCEDGVCHVNVNQEARQEPEPQIQQEEQETNIA